MLNRILKFSPLATLALIFVMTSCQKENLEDFTTENFTDPTEMQSRNGKRGKKGKKGSKCFIPVFPITINFPDGSSTTVADRVEAKAAKDAYKEANPETTERPTIAMPFDVMLKDSSTLTIASEEDLAALKETCGDRGGKGKRGKRVNRCFKPVFPITINFPDGSSATVADRVESKAAKDAYREANPETTERPTIAMPFEVMLKDSTVITISNEEDLAALKETCGEREGRGPRCFKPLFPLTINFPDGSSATVADRAEAKAAKKAFKAVNPDNTERPSLAYPYEVELADGTTTTVTSDEEVTALKEGCQNEDN